MVQLGMPKSDRSEYSKEYRENNRERINAQKREHYAKNKVRIREEQQASRTPENDRRVYLMWRYKMTPDQFMALFESQDGKCAICPRVFESTSGFSGPHIDHNHTCCPGEKSCGECVRGLLCRYCNVALGYGRDTNEWLESATKYINKDRKVNNGGTES